MNRPQRELNADLNITSSGSRLAQCGQPLTGDDAARSVENRRSPVNFAGRPMRVAELVGQLGHHQPLPARVSPPRGEPFPLPALYISRAARTSPEISSTAPRMVSVAPIPTWSPGGLEPGKATPSVRQAAVDITAHGVEQGDVDLGQQLAPTVAQAEPKLPRQGQGLIGRAVVATVALDAAKLVKCLRPGQVISQLGELLGCIRDDGYRRLRVSPKAGPRSRSRTARSLWPG